MQALASCRVQAGTLLAPRPSPLCSSRKLRLSVSYGCRSKRRLAKHWLVRSGRGAVAVVVAAAARLPQTDCKLSGLALTCALLC